MLIVYPLKIYMRSGEERRGEKNKLTPKD